MRDKEFQCDKCRKKETEIVKLNELTKSILLNFSLTTVDNNITSQLLVLNDLPSLYVGRLKIVFSDFISMQK